MRLSLLAAVFVVCLTTLLGGATYANPLQAVVALPLSVSGKISHPVVGNNVMTIAVTDATGAPVIGAKMTASVNMVTMDMGETHPVVTALRPGIYRCDVAFSMLGPWRVKLKIVLPGNVPIQNAAIDFTLTAAPLPIVETKRDVPRSDSVTANHAIVKLWKNSQGLFDQNVASSVTPHQVLVLLNQGADVNARDQYDVTPLMMAARSGNLDCTRVLIAKHADINAADTSGWTALHYAGNAGQPGCVRLLVLNGANIRAANAVGGTVLFYACQCGDVNLVRFLIKHGADVNVKDSDGTTPLMEAAYLGSYNVVQALVASHAKINTGDAHGWTALMQAASAGRVDCVKFLLDHGSDASIKTTDGDTALSAAGNNAAVVALLTPTKNP